MSGGTRLVRKMRKVMLNNPTSSKSVFIFSFYSILVNITCVVRINSDILISSSVNVNYVKKLKIDHPVGRFHSLSNRGI